MATITTCHYRMTSSWSDDVYLQNFGGNCTQWPTRSLRACKLSWKCMSSGLHSYMVMKRLRNRTIKVVCTCSYIQTRNHSQRDNISHQSTHLRCQKKKWPMVLLLSALRRRNLPKAQSRYGSNLSTCTSWSRYISSLSSLTEGREWVKFHLYPPSFPLH